MRHYLPHRKERTVMKHKGNVRNILIDTVKKQKWLSSGILIAVLGAIGASLIPPLLLGKIVDTITAGDAVAFSFFVLYFVVLALTGFMDTARESLLTVFGQKITHALRSRLMEKFVSLSADTINQQEPGTMVSRFIGDVDTVENLFTSGIISMFADTCKILSILAVIWFRNKGLTLVLLFLLPFLFWFTRHVQKNMLAAQIANRKAVGRASAHVPETLHNIRTIHCLGKENYMEEAMAITGGKGYEYVFETAGQVPTMHMAFELAANKAHVCFIGTPHADLTFTPKQWENMNRKEFKLTGSWMSYSSPFPGKEWDLTAHYFATGQLKFDPGFIYKKIPMSQAQEAFQMFKTPGLVQGKVMLVNED